MNLRMNRYIYIFFSSDKRKVTGTTQQRRPRDAQPQRPARHPIPLAQLGCQVSGVMSKNLTWKSCEEFLHGISLSEVSSPHDSLKILARVAKQRRKPCGIFFFLISCLRVTYIFFPVLQPEASYRLL